MTGDELHNIRVEVLGVTQAELARRAGVNINSVSRQEMGLLAIRPALARLYRLLGHLKDDALPIIAPELPRQFRKRRVGEPRRRRKMLNPNSAALAKQMRRTTRRPRGMTDGEHQK
jgi:transcriptional regulator with XRE-family HTH domain